MVVEQHRETVFCPIPDLPDERPVAEELRVGGEELVAEKSFEVALESAVFLRISGLLKEFSLPVRRPLRAVGCGEDLPDPVHEPSSAPDGWDRDDAVFIGELEESFALSHPLPLQVGKFHIQVEFCWPAVTEEACDGDVEDGFIGTERAVGECFCLFIPDDTPGRMAVKDPLGGIVGVRAGEAVGVLLLGNFLPVVEVEGGFGEGGVGDFEALVDFPDGCVVVGGGAEAPNGGEVGGIVGDNSRCILSKYFSSINCTREFPHLCNSNARIS